MTTAGCGPCCVDRLERRLAERSDVGIVGPLLADARNPEVIFSAGGIFEPGVRSAASNRRLSCSRMGLRRLGWSRPGSIARAFSFGVPFSTAECSTRATSCTSKILSSACELHTTAGGSNVCRVRWPRRFVGHAAPGCRTRNRLRFLWRNSPDRDFHVRALGDRVRRPAFISLKVGEASAPGHRSAADTRRPDTTSRAPRFVTQALLASHAATSTSVCFVVTTTTPWPMAGDCPRRQRSKHLRGGAGRLYLGCTQLRWVPTAKQHTSSPFVSLTSPVGVAIPL